MKNIAKLNIKPKSKTIIVRSLLLVHCIECNMTDMLSLQYMWYI